MSGDKVIKGIGVDFIEIERIKKLIEKDDQFITKMFSKNEIAYCEPKARKEQHYAARFTAKEAFFKAMGSGLRKGMKWKDVMVENNKQGKPEIQIKGSTLESFNKQKFKNILLSISHTRNYAISLVIIE
jgi:holo-[acyl-carrier protein] synthase